MANYRYSKLTFQRTKAQQGLNLAANGSTEADNLLAALKSIPAVNYNADHETVTRNIAMELDVPLHEDGQMVKFFDKAVELGAWSFAKADITETEDDWSSTITFHQYFPTDSAYDTWVSWCNGIMTDDGTPFVFGTVDNRDPNGYLDMGTVDFNKPYRT